MILLPPVQMAQQLIRPVLDRTKVAVDATVGNGWDTLFLAVHTPPEAHIVGFDIQEQALAAAARLLSAHNLQDKVTLIRASHGIMQHYVHQLVDVVMFNLGYLPGGDHAITTTPVETVTALAQATRMLRAGGLISIVVYTGHAGGMEEEAQVSAFLADLPQKHYTVVRYGAVNQIHNPPVLYMVEKRAG